MSLNKQIFWGMVMGISGGIILNSTGNNSPGGQNILGICEIVGGIFISLLKMILIPLIFTSLTVGISNLQAHTQMRAVWKTTLIFFACTTILASLLGLLSVNLFKPGIGLETALFQDKIAQFKYDDITPFQFLKSFIAELFLNPIKAMAEGKILPTVIFAIFFGIALIAGQERARAVKEVLSGCYELIMRIVSWIMRLAPLGIMALLVKLVASQDISIISTLGKFILLVWGVTLFHGIVVLPGILFMVTRMTPITFFKGAQEALLTAFSTSSSAATLPVSLRCAVTNLKANKEISGFVVPLGATVNMDGTALYEAIAAIFVANLSGIHLNAVQQMVVFFMAMIGAIGAPGIPSAGMVTMVMVLQSVGLPAEAIAILLPVDRLLDTIRTAVNVQGDMIGSVIVTRLTQKKNSASID